MSPADAIKALRFVTSTKAQVEFAPWGKHWWLSRPGLTDTKNLTLVRVSMRPGTGHRFHRHPTREEIIYVLDGVGAVGGPGEAPTQSRGDRLHPEECGARDSQHVEAADELSGDPLAGAGERAVPRRLLRKRTLAQLEEVSRPT